MQELNGYNETSIQLLQKQKGGWGEGIEDVYNKNFNSDIWTSKE